MSARKSRFETRSALIAPVRLGAAAVAACFLTLPALGNPVNPTVVNGSATFSQAGNVLTVTNSNGAIINWDKFSIGAGETTRFIQASASSSVLNRVLASDPSLIYGTLSSNGRVWLVNPAGIMVGAGGRVDVAGFVASTLNTSNENFLAGRKLFDNTPGAGNVVNQGEIRTPAGGSVYLIGGNVTNDGIITTPNGETILAAGQTVSLIDSATPGVKVDITGAEGNATNLGTITAEAGRIGIAGVIVRNSGILNASSVISDGGRIFLKASGDALVEGGQIRATSAGGKGGRVEVLGDRVAVQGDAEIDVSGGTGGGSILVGGDYQGANPDIRNASFAYIGADAVLKADATDQGNGGKVVVWADDTTRAHGRIYVRGGANGGNGGLVETSGHDFLDIAGARVKTMAPKGATGNWLLDPGDVTIIHSVAPVSSDFTGATSTISDYDINLALTGTTVTIATSAGSVGPGDITFNSTVGAPIVITSATTANTLNLNADRNIVFSGGNSTTFVTGSTGSLDIGLNATGNVQTLSGSSVVLSSGGGNLSAWLPAGKTWQNYGGLSVVANAAVHLGSGATFHNNSSGTANIAGTTGWAFWSNASDDGIINNDGVVNVTAGTAFEAAYNQGAGGTLNVKDVTLNLQNAQSISGTIDLRPAGATFAASMYVNEYHGVSASFSSVNLPGNGGTIYVGGTIGGTPRASFSNVTADNTQLNIGAPSNPGIVSFTGDSSFYGVSYTYGTLSALNNARLGITGGGFAVPTGVAYTGNVGYLANGTLSLPAGTSITTSGNVTLVGGWDGSTPFSSITGTTNGAGLTGITANLDFPGSSSVTAGGTLTLKASNNIRLLGDGLGGVQVNSTGAQGVYAKAQLQVVASSAVSNGNTRLATQSSQTITANSIDVKAGDGAGIHDSSADIVAFGDQQISVGSSALGWINVWSGTAMQDSGAYNNRASITHGQWGGGTFSGNQTITLGNGSPLDIRAGKGSSLLGQPDSECASSCAGASNSAMLSNHFGNLAISTPAGGSISVTGGSVGNNNWAGIENQTAGTMTVGTSGHEPSITITGGASGGSLGTKLPAYGGGINYNSNDASVSSDGTLTVYASTLDLNAPGSSGTYAAAYLGAPVVTVNTTGNMSMTGGSGNSAAATILSTPAAIGHENNTSITLNVGGNFDMTGGSGNGAMAMMGSLFGTANVTVNAGGTILMNGATAGADRIGSLLSMGGQIVLTSHGNMGLGTGYVYAGSGATDSVTLATNNNAFSQAAGGKIAGHGVFINLGTADATQPVGAIIAGSNLVATGNNLSFLGDNQAANVSLASTGAGGGIAYNTASGVHVTSATTATGDVNLTANAASGSYIALGTVTATAGNVTVTADKAILDDNGSALNITGNNISLTSTNGGLAGQLAISTDTSTTGSLTAAASGNYGGISIRNTSASTPGTITITDSAAAGNRVSFMHSGSDFLLNGSHSFEVDNGGDLGIFAGANMVLNGGPFILVPSAASNVLIGANGTMDLVSAFALPLNNLGLVSGGAMTIDNAVTAKNFTAVAPTIGGTGSIVASNDAILIGTSAINIGSGISVQGANVFLGGGALNLMGASVTATAGNVEFNVDSVNGTGGFISASHDIIGIASGNISLDGGSYFAAGNDVSLTFKGATSTISLSNGGYVLATNPNSIHLGFTARTSGGILIDGQETTKTLLGGSGFFVVDTSTPAVEGVGLHIAYATNGATDLCALSPALCKGPDDDTIKPPPKPDKPKDKKAACGDGDFGCDEDPSGKKDDKPGPKKVAQCSL